MLKECFLVTQNDFLGKLKVKLSSQMHTSSGTALGQGSPAAVCFWNPVSKPSHPVKESVEVIHVYTNTCPIPGKPSDFMASALASQAAASPRLHSNHQKGRQGSWSRGQMKCGCLFPIT